MNMKEIKEMLQLMKDHNLSEIEIEKDGLKLKLKKTGAGISFEQGAEMTPAAASYSRAATASPAKRDEVPAAKAEDKNIHVVKSPMVGTFYASPSPDQAPYVAAGGNISKGGVLCIIEAMKLMNEIKSDVGGTIVEILVTNGQAVEFDQPLYKIKTA